ncbi:hypothetical protein BDP55DRAFT_735478 [Colletotrichum godetiae]|uniref:non-reducing end alpha-L-arabinofuranosidase n=1 Tax=Colletotrichum godetiae TaxID=1209918 RepID=A0AAJ0A587_9PEZI|nr:uncharacterized protein BDP55DRAFT_735478 [Colletotrichum godetiae]KAK1656727.1 hypothetical protein BDP55DRAFT_735478 [Colletotrichum godetiae]
MCLEPFLDVYSGYSLDGIHITGEALSYPERFAAFYNAIRPTYPKLQLIASATGFNCLPDPFPEDAWIDYHEYNIPENYIVNFAQWDNVSRRNKYIIGEMGRWGVQWSDMKGSVSEAVFMLGLERNSDLIQGVAFAPLISLIDHQQWAVQQLSAQNAGTMTHEVISDTGFDPVFWSAVSAGDTSVVKLANYAGNDDPDSANTFDSAPITAPLISHIESSDGIFEFVMPPWSVAVLRAD